MKPRDGKRSIDWGHLALLGVIVLVIVAYLLDARATSLRVNNLLLVQPAAIIALVLAALVLPQVIRRGAPDDPANDENGTARETLAGLVNVGLLAAAFGVFVFSLETIGFDIATFAFTAIGLWICGERRLWVVVAYSAVFTGLLVYGYQQLVPYPFPLTLF